jgi:hypothetical protein
VLIRHLQFADNFGRVHGPYGHVKANAIVLSDSVVADNKKVDIGYRFEFTPDNHGVIRSFCGHSAASGLAAIGVHYSLDAKQPEASFAIDRAVGPSS